MVRERGALRMQGTAVETHEPFEPNIGRLDQGARFLLALVVVVGSLSLLPTLDAAWILPLFLAMMPLVAYLLLTAIVRTDILYHFLGRTAMRERTRWRAERRRRPRAARPLR